MRLVALFLLTFTFFSHGTEIIRPYCDETDRAHIIAILDQYPKYLRYETIGYAAGYTERCLTSKNYFTDVIEVDGKVVGFINYTDKSQFSIFGFSLFDIGGIIHLMGVDPAYTRKGYGKKLFEHAVAKLEAAGCPQLFLGVKKSNRAARSLYEKSGFACLIPFNENDPTECELFYLKRVPANAPRGFVQHHPWISTVIAASSFIGCCWATYRLVKMIRG